MKKEFLIERQGKTFCLYAGVLDLAHAQGLQSVLTTLVQIPSAENGQVAIVKAIIVLQSGETLRTFEGIGDASPQNAAPAMRNCLLRLAETRAKARALRDAVNIGVAAFEELTDEEASAPIPATVSAPAPLPAPPVSPLAERRLAVYGAFKDVGDNAEWRRGKLAQILGYSVVHAGKAFEEMTEAELGKVETWIETGALPEREGEEPPAEPAGMKRPEAASISHSEETRTREAIAR